MRCIDRHAGTVPQADKGEDMSPLDLSTRDALVNDPKRWAQARTRGKG